MATQADMTQEKDVAIAPAPSSGEQQHPQQRPQAMAGATRSNSFVISEAKNGSDKEQKMTLLEGIRLYPKAIGWSMLISTCIVMEGFQVCLLPNFYAFPQFREKYGVRLPNGDYQVPAPWQAGMSNGANVGSIIGLIINGYLSEKIGYRKTVMGALVLITAFISILFTADNVQTLLVGEILLGLPWGVFQTLTISYAAEVCPVSLRGHLTTYVNFCWGIGQVLGISSIRGVYNRTDQWAYRLPFALQWIWPIPLLIGIYFAPESPWWLVRQGRPMQAKHMLMRLTSARRNPDFDPDETIAMMVHTTALEARITRGASYWDCFKGTDLRRTEIVAMCWAIQNLSGNAFSGFSTYYLEQAGLSPRYALNFALGQYSINCLGVFGAWLLMALGIGRRTLYLYGLCGLFTMLLAMGFMGLVSDRRTASFATGTLMLIWALIYQLTVGTICYTLVAELSTRRLQIKTVVLGRAAYNVIGILCAVLTPYMVNPSAWNWGNYTAFFWAGLCACCIVYTFFRVPEPRGRTFAQLDVLFERKVAARKFAKTRVDVFEEEVDVKIVSSYEGTASHDETRVEKRL